MLFKLTWQYLRRHPGPLLSVVATQLVGVFCLLYLPSLNAAIIDRGITGGDIPLIWHMGAIMVGVTVVQAACGGIATYLSARIAMSLGQWLRRRVFTHVQNFSTQELHRFGASTLITRATNDVQQIQMVTLLTLTTMFIAPIMGLGGVAFALYQDRGLSVLLLILVPLIAAFGALMISLMHPRFVRQQKQLDLINKLLRSQLSGVRVIRAFVREDTETSRFRDANTELRRIGLSIGLLFAVLFPTLQFLVGAASVAVVWVGGYRIDAGTMEVGSMVAFLSYLNLILMSVVMAAMMSILVPRGRVSADRITEVLDTLPSIAAPAPGSLPILPEGPLDFALENVTLRYPGAEDAVLHDVDLHLKPGTTTAIIGPTAAGKTTLINLFPRLLEATSGRVLVGGIPVREIAPAALRRRIGLVPQRAYLFSGTLAQSLTGTRDDSEIDFSRLDWALEVAQAKDFVDALEEGVQTRVEPGGSNFSGGQRQRLTIARALYRRPDLLILDDSFSALDYTTDSKLRQSLRREVRDCAVLIVAQRVSTIRSADEVIVLEHGRIVGRGTHADLLQKCETYREIVASQEEVAV